MRTCKQHALKGLGASALSGREALELLCLQPVLQSLEHFSQFQPSHFLLIKFILDFRQALAFLRQFLNR